jgi:hypothetical protein
MNKVFFLGRFRLQFVFTTESMGLGAEIYYDKKIGIATLDLRFGPLFLAFWYNVTEEIIE